MKPKQYEKILKSIKNPVDIVKGIPIILGLFQDGQTSFYCPYCKVIHRHGIGSGFRVPHCCIHIDSPLKKSDYCLISFDIELIKTILEDGI